MSLATQPELVAKLANLQRLSPCVRFGELLANLGFLVEDQTDLTLRDVEDEDLLVIMERHLLDLSRRRSDA